MYSRSKEDLKQFIRESVASESENFTTEKILQRARGVAPHFRLTRPKICQFIRGTNLATFEPKTKSWKPTIPLINK